jgi:hypothetical protein
MGINSHAIPNPLKRDNVRVKITTQYCLLNGHDDLCPFVCVHLFLKNPPWFTSPAPKNRNRTKVGSLARTHLA